MSVGTVVAMLCPAGWGLRDMVHSGVTTHLRDAGIATLMVMPTDYLLEARRDWQATATGVALLRPRVTASPRGQAALNRLIHASFARRYRIATFAIFNRLRRHRDSRWERVRNAALDVVALVGSRTPFYEWQLRAAELVYRWSRDIGPVRQQLAAMRPAVVVSTNCVIGDEYPYILAARDLGIPTLACMQSFDNLTTRAALPVFDHYALWNQRMKAQLLKFYPDRDPRAAHITGTPQFDFHVRAEYRWSRADTLQCLGLRPNDRYILWGANHTTHTPDEPDRVAALVRELEAIPRLRGHRLVVRPHPLDDRARWKRGVAHARTVVSWPWDGSGRAPSEGDQAKLVSTLLHADVCLNTASTMSLDAAVVGTPVVCIAFGGREGHYTDHFRPIVESGGVRLACNVRELVDEILAYVSDRSRDAAERQRLVAAECGALDGRSATRVANLITQVARECRSRAGGAHLATPTPLVVPSRRRADNVARA